MTWSMASSGGDLFELHARGRSEIYDRDPFEDNIQDEFEDDDELDDDDDLEEEEEEEDDL